MSTENNDQAQTGQPRDEKGKFAPKTKTENNGQTQPEFTDYAFMNAFMAKQLGLSDKFADLSQKFSPKELYGHLKFTAMTNDKQQAPQPQSQGLPPNEKIAPITPAETKIELPGTQLHKPILDKENFSISFSMSPSELINPKKKE